MSYSSARSAPQLAQQKPNTNKIAVRSDGIARPTTCYRNQTYSTNGHVLGGGEGYASPGGVQNRTERLQAQFETDLKIFKEKQALKEAKKREEFLKKTAKYAGNVLGRGEGSNNNNDNTFMLEQRNLRLQESYQKDVDKFKESKEKKNICGEDKIMKENENLTNNLNQVLTEADHKKALRLRTERLQAQYNRDVNAFKAKQEMGKK
nr:uncharacterized protein LOC111425926 [Onthophagus taurus]